MDEALDHRSCTRTGQTTLQAPYDCKETLPAQYSLYVPVPALSSLLSGVQNGASALFYSVVYLMGLSGAPQYLINIDILRQHIKWLGLNIQMFVEW